MFSDHTSVTPLFRRRQSARESFQRLASGCRGPHHIGDHLIAHHHIPVPAVPFQPQTVVSLESRRTLSSSLHGGSRVASTITMSSLSARTVPFKIACIVADSSCEGVKPMQIRPLINSREKDAAKSLLSATARKTPGDVGPGAQLLSPTSI